MTIEDMLRRARLRIDRASPQQAVSEMEDGAVLVDMRCPSERRRTGIIRGSVAIGRSVLEWRADPTSPVRDERIAKPDARILLLCEEGYSSSLAAESLQRLGFDRVGDVIGGMESWIAEGLPVEPTADAG